MADILLAKAPGPMQMALNAALAGAGYDVCEARDGADALEQLERFPFRLLLTDLSLDLMDGVALALAARRTQPRLKVLMMSGDFMLARNLAALDISFDCVMQKPFEMHSLRHEVHRLLPGGQNAA